MILLLSLLSLSLIVSEKNKMEEKGEKRILKLKKSRTI